MAYHASAMEHLTSLSQKVQQFDEEAESKVNLQTNSMNLNSFANFKESHRAVDGRQGQQQRPRNGHHEKLTQQTIFDIFNENHIKKNFFGFFFLSFGMKKVFFLLIFDLASISLNLLIEKRLLY